jgi:hypothetical protein
MKQFSMLAIAACLSACASTTTIRSTGGPQILVNDRSVISGQSSEFSDTSFGQYKFKTTDASGKQTFVGLLPLKFHGGYLALDILLFAPATLFNLRGVYPEYELDPAAGIVRFRKKPTDAWLSYQPTPAEKQHAEQYFLRARE